MTLYLAVLTIKFLGIMSYAGGLIASFVATPLAERKRAVHRIASPGLLAIWCAGYMLVELTAVKLYELWIVSGFVLSFVSQIVLVYSVSRERRSVRAFLGAALPLIIALIAMIWKPTWATLTLGH